MRPRSPIRSEAQVLLDLDGRQVPCLLRRSSARRTLTLRVDAAGRVVVNLPMDLAACVLKDFLARHLDWLRLRLDEQGAPLWQEGASLPYLGQTLLLARRQGIEAARRAGEYLLVPEDDDPGPAVLHWYRQEADRVLAGRIAALCRLHGRPEPQWRLSGAHTRWGSLSASGVMRLNWRLVKAPVAAIDYVICHELAHFRHPHHGPAFWQEVARLFPEHAAARRLLRQNGALYLRF